MVLKVKRAGHNTIQATRHGLSVYSQPETSVRLVIQTLGWLVILQGISLGMLTIAVVGEAPVGVTTGGRILAAVVVGLTPVLAGLIALRNRRIAAKIDFG